MTVEKIRMDTPFDHTAEHQRDIQPHIDAIFEKCKELDIPCLVSVCYANDPRETGTSSHIAMAANFCGPNKTPPTFVLASIAIEEGPEETVRAALSISAMVSGYDAERVGDDADTVH